MLKRLPMKLLHLPVLLLSSSVFALGGGFYSEDSPVLELTPKTFKEQVIDSNSVSIVEFYAPWCGHCKNLAPEYVKAAKSLKGLANVAAVNCDDQINQPICSKYKIQGFPTIKVFRPHKVDVNSKRNLNDKKNIRSKPAIENYNGEREAKSIVDFIISRLRNYVLALKPSNIDKFLSSNTKPRVIVLASVKSKHSGTGIVPPLLKSLSSDFVYKYSFGYIDYKQGDELWEKFALNKRDSQEGETSKLIIVGNDDKISIYKGKLNKASISEFLNNHLQEAKEADRKKRRENKEKLDL